MWLKSHVLSCLFIFSAKKENKNRWNSHKDGREREAIPSQKFSLWVVCGNHSRRSEAGEAERRGKRRRLTWWLLKRPLLTQAIMSGSWFFRFSCQAVRRAVAGMRLKNKLPLFSSLLFAASLFLPAHSFIYLVIGSWQSVRFSTSNLVPPSSYLTFELRLCAKESVEIH